MDLGAYRTPVPAGCVGEGRGCLCHGMGVTAPNTSAGCTGRVRSPCRTPNPRERTMSVNTPFFHPFPLSQLPLPALLKFSPNPQGSRHRVVLHPSREALQQPVCSAAEDARRGQAGCSQPAVGTSQLSLNVIHTASPAVAAALVGRGCLAPKPPCFSPPASPLLQLLASPLYKTQGSSLLLLTPFSLGLLSSAIPGRGGMEGGEEAFGSVPPLITCA